jgi:hypothetical protein
MEALLRELHEGPDGIPEYRDTEISGADLTIGSAADQRIQLLGRAVAPEHAVIKKSGSKLELSCRGGKRVRINGKSSSAKLEIGDVVELAGHQLTIVEAPGGFDVAIELRPNENIDASEFESAFRTDLGQTWLSKRPAAWLLVAIVLIAGVVLPVGVIVMHRAERAVPAWVPGDEFWNSGPLSPAHQQAAGVRCDTCHQQPFIRVQDEACLSCHKTIHDHVSPEHLALTQLGPTHAARPVIASTTSREPRQPATRCASTATRIRPRSSLSCTWSR